MLMPSIFGENLFDDLFDSFPFYDNATKDVEKKLYGRKAAHMMKTDIKEKSDGYELVMDLPGFTMLFGAGFCSMMVPNFLSFRYSVSSER